jgi:hypothetical protein
MVTIQKTIGHKTMNVILFICVMMPSRTQPRRMGDVNREGGTEMANRRRLQ